MALRWAAAAWRTQLNTFDAVSGNHRFYLDFRQRAYPPIAGTPTFTAIASGDNQPGTYNLTGSYAKYLLALTDEVTIRARVKPSFAFNTGSDQPVWSWYMDANRYLTLYYAQATDKYTVKWKDGGTERTLESAAYVDNPTLQVWTDIDVAVDVANGTGALYIDRSSVDATWSGAADVKSSYFPTFEIAGENAAVGDYDINHVRMFLSLEATAAQVLNNFRDIKSEETYWPLDGHVLGRTRCNVTRFVTEYTNDKEIEKAESGSQSANRLSMTLKSFSGQFADDQYAAFNPDADQFNGTSAQKYMQARVPIIAETWYGNTFEPFFVGRLDEDMFRRDSGEAGHRSHVTVSAEDFVAEIANTSLPDPIYYEDKDLCDSTETNSLVHLIGRLASKRKVYNLLANSSFENAVIANSWAVSGAGATLTRVGGGLFGSFQGDLVYGAATCTVAQTITFTGSRRLSPGETFTFSIYLLSASACAYNIYLVEADSGGDNASTSAAWSLAAGKGWKRFEVTRTITDTTSDRLIVRVSLDDNVTLCLDAAMLTQTDRAVDWFVLNDNDGAAAVESADDADYDSYEQIGYDCDAVDIQHGWVIVEAGAPIWDKLKEIANATGARYMGIDAAGALRFRSPLKTGFADPSSTLTLAAARDIVTSIATDNTNRVIVHGVRIIKPTAIGEVWNAKAAGVAPATFGNGDDWPDATTYPEYWAKYETGEFSSAPPVMPSHLPSDVKDRLRRVTNNTSEQEIIGIKSPTLTVNAWRYPTRPYIALGYATNYFDTTTRSDAARILITNNSGSDGTLQNAAIRGTLVLRYSGSQGFLNDRHKDEGAILRDGESSFEVGNNFIVTQTQVDTLADYYWKENRRKHTYELTIHGERLYFEPGEWYTLQLGGAGQAEYIDVLARCISVSVQRNYGDMGTTQLVLREVEQNWVFNSNALARYLASGNTMALPGSTIFVAASTYVGPADYYCDGTADHTEIQAAIDALGANGGVVRLSAGTFNITAAIEMVSNVALIGSGAATIIEKNCNDHAIEAVGGAGTELTGVELRDFTVIQNSADTNSISLIYFDYSDASAIFKVKCVAPYRIGIHVYRSDGFGVQNCEIDFTGGARSTGCWGIYIQSSTSVSIFGCYIHGGASVITATIIGIYVNSGNAVVQGNSIASMTGYIIEGIDCSAEAIVSNNTVSDLFACSVHGIIIRQTRAQARGNLITNCFDSDAPGGYKTGAGLIIYTSAVVNATVTDNMLRDNGSLLLNGSCESNVREPSFSDSLAITLSNCTWARSGVQEHLGSYSFLFTKTIAAGTAAYVSLGDNETTSDMHVAVAGVEYTFSVWVYIPAASGILGSEITLNMDEYHTGTWNAHAQAAANTYDAWQEVTVNTTLNAAAAGFRCRITAASAAALNEYFYTDSLRLKQHGIRNDYSIQYADYGTGTQLG